MKNSFRVVIILVTLLVGLAATQINACAAPVSPSYPNAGQVHSSIVVNTRTDIIPRGVSLIQRWSCGIRDNLNGTVTVTGDTTTYGTVQYLDVKVCLQRLSGSNWVDVTNKSYSRNNSSYVSGSASVAVQRGYSYRIKSTHNASNSSTSDTQQSFSNIISVK